jgi:SAM-dependent methyltransferase
MSYAIAMAKGFAPAAERNRQPILDVLRRVLPPAGLVLEVASGTGQHAIFFSERLPELRWQPSDASPEALQSIEAWVDQAARDNLLPPLELDVRSAPWPIPTADALLCINMIHISPWETTEALFGGASPLLAGGSLLITYGPYRVHGEHTASSNAAFDKNLRSRNPRWGVRDIEELTELAGRTGFTLRERVDMPANNMTLVWARDAYPGSSSSDGSQKSITK